MDYTFYKSQPSHDAPYRQLTLKRISGSYVVKLFAGVGWVRRGERAPDPVQPPKPESKAEARFQAMADDLIADGWELYMDGLPH